MDVWPKISLITPSYNQAIFLRRTIQSVLSQNYPNLEYIIIDGNSSDNSVEVIKEYVSNLAYWISEPDDGQSNGINKGLKCATGEIIGWLNSDDTLASGALHRIADAYRSHPNIDLIYGNTSLIDADDRVIKHLVSMPTTSYEIIHYNRNVWSQPGTTWRRRLQDKIGLLDETLHYTMDNDFWIRAALNGTIHFVPHHLANLRIHSMAKGSRFTDRFYQEQLILDERYGAEFQDRFHHFIFKLIKLSRCLRSGRSIAYKLMGHF